MLNNGGGITNACAGTVTLNNTTVSGNIALGNGGGIFNAPFAMLTLNNSTISENAAAGNGGGICGVTILGSRVTINAVMLNNSIISGNTASFGNELYLSKSFVDADNSNLFGDSGESGESDAEAFSGFVPGASDVNATGDGTSGILIATALSDILNPLADNGGLTMTHALLKRESGH